MLSIPLSLLWIARIDFRRKLILAAMLCLSVFMIIIAIVRVTASELPGGVADTSWLFFWQTMEAAIAVIMVALTGFRSLFYAEPSTRKRSASVFNHSQRSRERYDKLSGLGSITPSSVGVSCKRISRSGSEELELQELNGLQVAREVSVLSQPR